MRSGAHLYVALIARYDDDGSAKDAQGDALQVLPPKALPQQPWREKAIGDEGEAAERCDDRGRSEAVGRKVARFATDEQ